MKLTLKNICFFIFMIALCGTARAASADRTEIESFIEHIRLSHTFVKVDYLWQADNNFNRQELDKKVSNAQPLSIDYANVARFIQDDNRAISLEIPGSNGQVYTIELAKYDFLSGDFKVQTQGANGQDAPFAYHPGLYYRGIVKGFPGSVAAFSFFNNEIYGIFSIPGQGNYNVVPNTMVGKYYDSNPHYILYNDQDLKIKEFAPKCYTDDLPEIPDAEAKTTTTVNNKVFNNCTEIRVFEVGDYALYSAHGHSVTNTTNFLTALFNNQAVIYKNEGIIIVLKYLQIDSAADVYSTITTANSAPFLDTFGKKTQNTLHGCDLAILASAALNGGYGALGGLAWVKAMCATYTASNFFGPYGFCDLDNSATAVAFPTFSWDVNVMCHEMGHIVGSPHTHRCCWNPPGTGTTAIDACAAVEGSCSNPVPAYPVAGGTIMSYCHTVSVGINFSNGFGPQPGDTIRYFIAHKFSGTCGAAYHPATPNSKPNRTILANRECTDMTTSTTYYWYDNNTASQADDTLVLMINKNGNDIGNLNSAGFAVTAGTTPNYGIGKGDTISFPAGTPGIYGRNIAMRRWWNIATDKSPATAIEVMYPYLPTDTADVDGSVPGTTPLVNFKMYKTRGSVNPSPVSGFAGALASTFSIYTFGTTASSTVWSLSSVGTTQLAHMLMTNLPGGGTGFYTYVASAIENINQSNPGVYIYPNPAQDKWFVSVDNSSATLLSFQLYAVDGKLVQAQALSGNTVNTVDATKLAPGIYYYRIIGSANTITGSLQKK